ncbi:hypothetical protein MKW94_001512 [Papaver nudicaule]|uniref:RING-type domain-containing protein n=1 Tax=Papaver nudicaule TaxID=74823 RepID=A0AA41RYG3_PAPNU|nr:hypothetical protein [Papaver nudicaule]
MASTLYVSCNIIKRGYLRNPSPEQSDQGFIQIDVEFRERDCCRTVTLKKDDKIENLCLRSEAKNLVCGMLSRLQVPADSSMEEEISRSVFATAERAASSKKPFLVYAKFEVIDVSDDEDVSDEESSSDNIAMDTVVALSIDAYEKQGVGASRSAIDGLKREAYSYKSCGHDEPTADTNTCVICMEKFEARTVVTYMPCSHMFHEYCLVPWLQENHSCPLCRFEIQSCS